MYYNLGSDLLDNYSEQDVAILTKDKLVFIGNMVEDYHDTYAGVKPGMIITYQALKALMDNEHIVSWGLLSVLSAIFFLISLSLYQRNCLSDRLPFIRKIRSRLLNFVISLFGYASILFVTVVVINIFFNRSVSILMPSLYFTTLNLIIKYKNTKI